MNRKNITAALFMILIFSAFAYILYDSKKSEQVEVPYLHFMDWVTARAVESVNLNSDKLLSFKKVNDETLYLTDNPRKADFKEEMLLKGVKITENDYMGQFSQVFFMLCLFGGFALFYRRSRGGVGAMALNAASVPSDSQSLLSFDDIAGNDEAKESVIDIVDFIKNPEKYTKYGAKMPRGIILYGPPGTGKTLMAKAIAGEAGVPFYAVSGSDFVQMYVGVGAGRVRELFKKAREAKKAVIFIDEIDALGKKRSNSTVGGNDEREQTLNALLTEMSGFDSKMGIVVVAATNRLDTLDEALLRPGRFDRQIEIGLPDLNARERILSYYAESKPIAGEVSLKALAKQTVYFSGAMLEGLMNEAAILAAKGTSDKISNEDFDKAYYTIIAGSEKKDRSGIAQRDREITAIHEAGHALISALLLPQNTIAKVTIIPSTKGAGGFCVNIPAEKLFYTKSEMEGQVCVSLGGRAAEESFFGSENITTGASNDIEKATSILMDYVAKYGMGKDLLNRNLFEGKDFYEECKELAETFYHRTMGIIQENKELLKKIADELLERETLNEEALKELLDGYSRPQVLSC